MNAIAQADLTSAFNSNKDGKYEEAVMYIEKAAQDPKATAKEKYWRYRGNIYLNVAKNPELLKKYPNALILSRDAYFKSMELDTHKDYLADEVRPALVEIQNITLEHAQNQYEAKSFCDAAENFIQAKEISDKFAVVDSGAIFNAAYCYDKCGNKEKAIAGYRKCGEIGYQVPNVYMYIADVQERDGKAEEAMKTLQDARVKFPKDPSLLRAEVNLYLTKEEYTKAEQLLKSLVDSDPKNETIWYVLGATLEKLGKKNEQEAAYKKALEINPNYYDALFNLGAMYFNDGLEKEKSCNDIPPKEQAKYNDCVAQSKVLFTNAVEVLERAYNLKSDERDIISGLKDAYYKVGNMDGYNKLKSQLNK